MSSPVCLNCEASLDLKARFCPVCGQKSDTHRLTFFHIIHDFFHAFTHADKGIFSLLRELAIRPGVVAKEYIAGKRKKYFNPFTFFLILAGLFVLSDSFFNTAAKKSVPDQEVLAHLPNQAARDQYLLMFERGAEIGEFMKKHGNLVALFAVPLFGLITWVFMRRNRYNFAENFTANLMFVTFGNIIFTVLIYPVLGQVRGNDRAYYGFLMLGLVLQTIYFTWCYYQFQPVESKLKLLKAFALSVLGVVLWQLVYMLVMAVYLYRDFNFYKFFLRMFQ